VKRKIPSPRRESNYIIIIVVVVVVVVVVVAVRPKPVRLNFLRMPLIKFQPQVFFCIFH